ncbi:MAG: hypothetical protein QOJ65_2005 [Fimbriimonadaceae bacterium]|nr:hypothetical protein [Fimbriimonadaceae bacterium]
MRLTVPLPALLRKTSFEQWPPGGGLDSVLVYGDPSRTVPLGCLLDDVEDLVSRAAGLAGLARLDAVRTALIRAGEIEQALEDAGLTETVGRARALTDSLAAAFIGELEGADVELAYGLTAPLRAWDEVTVTAKVPEGFAFYGLYPEQYAAAASAWAMDHPRGSALVIGIRSIGTTLCSVACNALRAQGREEWRLTVRPEGQPFQREVDIPCETLADWVLIVDEGPGLSGSSMASVVTALVATGYDPGQIAFLPGHSGEPGSAASGATRSIWKSTKRYTAAPQWDGRGPQEILALLSKAILGSPIVDVADLGAGAWRERAYSDPSLWPAVFGPFEKAKFLCVSESGDALLWKYTGLDQEADALGYTARAWIAGSPLRASDWSPCIRDLIVEHIASAAGPAVEMGSFERLTRIVEVNVAEALGPSAAQMARVLACEARRLLPESLPSSGDGRMAPHEWIRSPAGIVKPSCKPTRDHTFVGSQSIVWDLAGVAVEWRLGAEETADLLDAYILNSGIAIPARVLEFNVLAYSAFKLGLAELCLSQTDDDDERRRLAQASADNRGRLTALASLDGR